MFAAVDLHRRAQRQRGADGVGALVALAPGHARQQRHLLRLAQKSGAAGGVEDHAGGIAEQHDAAPVADLLVQAVQFRLSQAQQQAIGLAQGAQRRAVQAVLRRLRRQLPAAPPGLGDFVAEPNGLRPSWKKRRRAPSTGGRVECSVIAMLPNGWCAQGLGAKSRNLFKIRRAC